MAFYSETEVGLKFEKGADPEFAEFGEEWDQACGEIRQKQFKIADLYLFGERKYGERVAQVIDVRMISRRRLSNWVWVARKFGGKRKGWRRNKLSYSHHEAVAGIIDDPDAPELTGEAKRLLDAAEDLGLSVDDLEQEVARLRGRAPEQNNPLMLIQQARNLCEEAEPLTKGPVKSMVRSARSSLEDAAQELADNQEFTRATRSWFPADQVEVEPA